MFGIVLSLPAAGAGSVGNGTPESCTEKALDAALVDGGRITFNCGAAPATIWITSPKFIKVDTHVDGDDRIVLDAGGHTLLFDFEDGRSHALTGLTLQNGYADSEGGAVTSGAAVELRIRRCTFRKNVSNHRDYGGGGAIQAKGRLFIAESLFVDNEANGPGGAIHAAGEVSIVNTTFRNNRSERDGGAIYSVGDGLAVLRNVTIADSAAVGRGASIYRAGSRPLRLDNVVVATSSGTNCAPIGAVNFLDGGGNLQFNAGGRDASCGTRIPAADPMLAPLADNGGPTWTMALPEGSPALGAAVKTNCPAADQRGYVRSRADACDAGAYQSRGKPNMRENAVSPRIGDYGK